MTYVVTETCIRCKYTDCVEVCPVDCFHEDAQMLVIDPATCIDCGVCEPACPIAAIKPDTDAEGRRWRDLNEELSGFLPGITGKHAPYPGADGFATEGEKFSRYMGGDL